MSADFDIRRQTSWHHLSAAASKLLNLPQFNSQLRNLSYHDKYIIHYEVETSDQDQAISGLTNILDAVHACGLHTEVRTGYDQSILIFVKAPPDILGNTVYKSRVRDWLYGTTSQHPRREDQQAGSVTESENLLGLHHLIVWPHHYGGAGLTPGHGRFSHVKSVFPLHNPKSSLSLLGHLGKRLYLKDTDFDLIRDLWGSKTAFYFAFTQTYILFLFFPAVAGILVWLFAPPYSPSYALLMSLWGICFVEYWKIQETDLSMRWSVKGVGSLKVDRPQFIYETELVDEAGRIRHLNPEWKQFTRQLLQVPFILVSGLLLGSMILAMFVAGVLISETYTGPFILYLELIPTAILAMPWPTQFLETIASTLTEFENHQTADAHERSLAQKVFVFSCITQYLPILLTAFVYMPFGDIFIPKMQQMVKEVFGEAAKFRDTEFQADKHRLQHEVIALTITGQVLHFGEEFFFPLIKEVVWTWYYNRTRKPSGRSNQVSIDSEIEDDQVEVPFLRAARTQAHLPPYDVQQDISQMVLQFGYLALFSPVWPLVPLGFLISNWIELRSDFLKICIEHQRPPPLRSDGIGPWVQNLELLSWLGSLSGAAICHIFQCKANDSGESGCADGWWTLPLTIVLSEHGFLAAKTVVQSALRKAGSEQIRKKEKNDYIRRKQYLDDLEANKDKTLGLGRDQRERRKSMLVAAGDSFWTTQLEDQRSLKIGTLYINTMMNHKGKRKSH